MVLVITIENPVVTAVGVLGNIISICAILAPVPTFYRIYKKKSTESFHSVPYVVALFSAMLWLYYAFLTKDVLLTTINVFSGVLESFYIVIYLLYAPTKQKGITLKLMSLLNLGLFGSIALLTFIFLKGEKRADVVGFLGATLSVSVFAAPLSVIVKTSHKDKERRVHAFSAIFFLTLGAVSWFFYGLLMKDYFVALPNVVGFTFGVAQMVIYFMYMNKKRDGSEVSLPGEQAKENIMSRTAESEIEIIMNDGRESTFGSRAHECQCSVPAAAKPEIQP